jgi:GT2 family glycosyltransferase
VVNDGGDDSPDGLVSRFETKLSISSITQEQSGPASARNTGAKIAKGTYLAFTDDDCLPDPGWLTEFEECLKKNPESIVGGKTLNLLDNNIYSTASQLICDLAYNHYNRDSEQAGFFCTNNMAVPKMKFLEIGGFDERFKTAEDRDLCKRWKNHGFNMTYCPKAIVYHAHNLTFPAFVRQHFKYGRGSYDFYRKKSLHGPGYFRDLLSFNFNPRNLFLYPLSKNQRLRGTYLISLMIIWQLVNGLGFLFEAVNKKVNFRNLKPKEKE